MKKFYLFLALLLSTLGVTQMFAQDEVEIDVNMENGQWVDWNGNSSNPWARSWYSTTSPAISICSKNGSYSITDIRGNQFTGSNNMSYWGDDQNELMFFSRYGGSINAIYEIAAQKGYYIRGVYFDFNCANNKNEQDGSITLSFENGDEITSEGPDDIQSYEWYNEDEEIYSVSFTVRRNEGSYNFARISNFRVVLAPMSGNAQALMDLQEIFERYNNVEFTAGTLPGQYDEVAVEEFYAALEAANIDSPDFVEPETAEEIEALGQALVDAYENVLASKVPMTLENGYYRIKSALQFTETYEDGEGNYMTESVTKYMGVRTNNGSFNAIWYTPEDMDAEAPALWRVSMNGDLFDIVNAAYEYHFANTNPFTLSEGSDSLIAIEPVTTDEDDITTVVFRLVSKAEGGNSYFHVSGHKSGMQTVKNSSGNIVSWYPEAAASQWIFERVDDEEARSIMESYAPNKDKELMLVAYDTLMAAAKRDLNNAVSQLSGKIYVDTEINYITSADQLSSPYSDSEEGQDFGALLDYNTRTFWHSDWHNGNVANHTHYLQVALTDAVDEDLAMTISRRLSSNDHITAWSVFGSNNADAEVDEWEYLTYIATPYGSNTETLNSLPFNTRGYKYLRFYIDGTTTGRGYGHLSEFQLHPASVHNVSYLQETMLLNELVGELSLKERDDIQQDDYDALLSKYNAFIDAYNNGQNDPEPDTYYIKCVANGEGAITADKYEAAEGETVTLAATLAEGYMVDNMTIATEYGDSVAYKVNEAALTATFVMPAANVMVTINFKKIKDDPIYGMWTAPEPMDPDTEPSELASEHVYKVRNVESQKYIGGGQAWFSWSTTAVLKELEEEAISFTLSNEEKGWTLKNYGGAWDGKYLFVSGNGKEGYAMHVDNASDQHRYFEIIDQGDYRYRLRVAASDDTYGQANTEDWEYKFMCWDKTDDTANNGALQAALVPDDENTFADFEFIDQNVHLFVAKTELYNLAKAIDDEELDVDYQQYTEIYYGDDYEAIKQVASELQRMIDVARTYAVLSYGEDGENPPSENNPCDATALIKNNSFDTGNTNGWTCTFKSGVNASNTGYQRASYTNGDVTISGFIEAWANSSTRFNPNINFAAIGDGKLSQTMANLPQGKYRFTCDAIAVQQYQESANPVTGVELFAVGGELETTQNIATGNGLPQHFELTFVSTGGDVEIGLRTNNATANWIAVDNFTLTYYGETSEDPAKVLLDMYIADLEEKFGDADEIMAYKDVKEYYLNALSNAKNAVEDYDTIQLVLKEAASALQVSIDEYAAFIADVEAFLEKVEGAAEEWPGLSNAVVDLYQDARNSYYEGTATSESMANFANNSSQAIADYVSENVVPGKDVSILLNNPGFATDLSGWTVDKNGKTPTFGGENVVLSEDNPVYQYTKDGVVDGGCAEVWHGNFDIYQTIKNMPAGVYTLSCQAYERDENGNGVEAELYAFINGSEQTQKVIEINEDASNVQLYNGEAGGHGEAGSNNADRQNDYGLWIPNGMCGANVHFRAGYYNTNFDFILDEQGDITIGIRTKSNSDWVLFDDFKIVYKGKDANQLASTIDNLTEQIYLAQENEYGLVLTKDVQAEVEAAIAVGQEAKAGNDFDQSSAAVALLRQTLVDVQNNLQSLKAFYDEWIELCDYRFEGLDEDYYGISSLEIPYEIVDEINEKLQNGDIAFENLAEMEMYRQEVKRQYTQAVMETADYSSASEDCPVNVTAAIYNPNNRSYENYWDDEYIGAKGWNIEGSVGYGNSGMRATEFYQQSFDINQTIYGLAPGWYRLKVNGFYRDGYASRIEDCLNGNEEEHKYATLYAGDAETPLLLVTDKESRIRYSDILNDYGIEYIDESNSNRLYYINEYGDEEETYIPYNSRAANAAFNFQYEWGEEPLWQNVLQFYVEEGQESVTIGIRKEYDYEDKSGDWTVFKNWQLEYVGTEEPANDPTTGGDYVEEPTAEELAYKRALESIEDGGIYRISANYNGSTYYLNGKGYLVDNASEAGIFNFSKISGSQYNWGFYVETEGRYFTNAPGTTAEYLSSGYICQSDRNRNEWEAQVFFLNEEGKYAVRSTNAKYAASSWSWIGSAYWTVEGDSIPVAQYSFDDNYIWELEKIEKHEVTSYLVWNGDVIDEYVSVQPLGSAPVVPQSFSDEMRGMYKFTANVDSITAETEEVYFTATWNGPFEFSESYEKAKWYHMDINNGYYVAMNESEPYTPTMDQDLEAEESLWAFLPVEGDPTGVKVINYAAGADMSLMRDGSYIVMRDGEFYWSVYSNSDGFSLCPQGSNYNWIYWSRYLRTYGSSYGNGDVRCKLRVTKADVNEFPENIMVKNEKTLNYAGKDVPEDYRPNITLAPTDMWIGDTGEPSTLGALTLKTDKVFSIGKLTMNFNPAQTNYYRYEWKNDEEIYIPHHTTMMAEGQVRADSIVTRMTLTDGQWNFITVPYDVRVGDIYCENQETDWVIRRYDGAARAELRLDETWVNVGADEILEAGKGYIMHCSYSPNWLYNSQVFYFPSLNTTNKNLIFSSDDRVIALEENLSEFAHNRSWNLIGNPFAAYVEFGSTGFDAPITVWDGQGNYLAYSPIDDEYYLSPGEAFFVQRPVGESAIIFDVDARMSWYEAQNAAYNNGAFYAPARLRKASSNRSVLNLTLSDGEKSDRTRVVINPEAELAYETSCDAAKFMAMNANATQLFTVANGVQYAINERPLADGTVQLAARFGKAGTYTLRLQTASDMTVILVDKANGTMVELSSIDGYTFEALAGNADNRFSLIIGTSDGIGTIAADELRDARIFTLDGKRLPSDKQPVAGVYLIQQKNGTVRKALLNK